jgi:polyisoprenoid-binding protein YceI
MRLPTASWPLMLLCFGIGPACAQVEHFELDPVHTRIAFQVDHAGLSRAIGTFSRVNGRLSFDPEDWRGARLEVTVPLATLELGDADWNRRMLERSFLDAGRQAEARFVSTRVEPGEAGRATVFGELSLRGVSREVALDVTMNALKRNPVTMRRSAGFSATASLSRRDFGMDSWPNVIGDRIELQIEAEAIRVRDATIEDSAQPEPKEQTHADQE